MKSLKEYIADILYDSRLFEMAISRADYINHLNGLRPQIFQNWCLIKYGKKNNIPTINHWKIELRSYLTSLNGYEVKSSNKYDIIKRLWIDKYEYHKKWELIASDLDIKFEKEGITNAYEIDELAKMCSQEIFTLITIINSNRNDIIEYVKNL